MRRGAGLCQRRRCDIRSRAGGGELDATHPSSLLLAVCQEPYYFASGMPVRVAPPVDIHTLGQVTSGSVSRAKAQHLGSVLWCQPSHHDHSPSWTTSVAPNSGTCIPLLCIRMSKMDESPACPCVHCVVKCQFLTRTRDHDCAHKRQYRSKSLLQVFCALGSLAPPSRRNDYSSRRTRVSELDC